MVITSLDRVSVNQEATASRLCELIKHSCTRFTIEQVMHSVPPGPLSTRVRDGVGEGMVIVYLKGSSF